MIIKNLTRTSGSARDLLNYLLRYALDEEKQIKNQEESPAFVMHHNLKSRKIDGFVSEFRENETRRNHRRKGHAVVHHTILSWNPLDASRITNTTLKAVAKEYVKQRGVNNLYIFAAHKDKAHTHLHICTSGSQLNGKSSRLTKDQFATLKVKMTEFQKMHFPELVNSLVAHGRAKNQQVHLKALSGLRPGVRPLQKDLLGDVLEKAYKKSSSIEEFEKCLTEQGYKPYYRGSDKKLTGVELESGVKFRLRRFGYDKEKIDSLTTKSKEERGLREIQAIRDHAKEPSLLREVDNERILSREEDIDEREHSSDCPESLFDSFQGFGVFPQKVMVKER